MILLLVLVGWPVGIGNGDVEIGKRNNNGRESYECDELYGKTDSWTLTCLGKKYPMFIQ